MTKNATPAKLPAKQLAILAVARFAEPLAMTSVFPYLPEMIASFGIGEEDIAHWAGLTSSVFSLSQSLTAVWWGRASDKIGRKPTIIVGLICTMICFVLWGFSTSLPMAIAIRAVQGGSNGNVGIIRTMVAEMVPQRELQPTAFSIMPLVWSLGSIFGPAFGGFFANPARQFPALFGNSEFFKAFPFALPNLMGSVFFLISGATAILFLKETLETKRNQRDWGLVLGERLTSPFRRNEKRQRMRRFSFQDAEASAPLLAAYTQDSASGSGRDAKVEKPQPTSMASIFTRQSSINLIAYSFLALHSIAFDQVLPVFLHYPRDLTDADHSGGFVSEPSLIFFSGGFGLTSNSIGTIFTLYGIVCGLIQFLVFPPLCSRFGTLNCLKACCVIFPFAYSVTPYTTLIQDDATRYVALLSVMIVKAFAVIVGFPCTTILLTNSATSVRILGTLNGFATTFSGLGRAAGPFIAGTLFTWGVKRNFIALPWWLLSVISVFGAIPVWFIEEGEGPSRQLTEEEEEEALLAAVEQEEEEAEENELDHRIIAGDSFDAALAPPDNLQELEADEAALLVEVGRPATKDGDSMGMSPVSPRQNRFDRES